MIIGWVAKLVGAKLAGLVVYGGAILAIVAAAWGFIAYQRHDAATAAVVRMKVAIEAAKEQERQRQAEIVRRAQEQAASDARRIAAEKEAALQQLNEQRLENERLEQKLQLEAATQGKPAQGQPARKCDCGFDADRLRQQSGRGRR